MHPFVIIEHNAHNILGPSLSSPRAPDPIPSGPSRRHDSVTPGNPATPGNYLQINQPAEALPYDDSVDGTSPGKFEVHIASLADQLMAHKATDRTSGPAFESQVKSLLHRSKSYVPPASGTYSNTHGPSGPVGWTSVQGLVDNVDDPSIPSPEESQYLLDQFLYYLGVSQHFFDSRSFSDQMGLLFQTAESQEQQKQTTWYTEYLLVMAMAKLMDVEQPRSQPPGSELFSEALKRLPPLHDYGSEGVIVVEILTLVATYLQWCDRKHDAYIYVCPLPSFFQACILTRIRLVLL